MTRLAIIADDLSSATDCGAQVARSGLSVVASLHGCSIPPQARAVQVISVDTDSRSLSADQAYTKVRAAALQLVADGWTHFYKSVDSTLRGNLGAEIEAVLEAVKPDCAVIAPAFPKYGRTTVGGVQFLYGRPLHETEFGTDPTAPVRDADIVRRLAAGSRRPAGRITLDQLRAGPVAIKNRIQQLLTAGVELVIVDIAEQDDLERICAHLSHSDLRVVWVGSTGLAEFVPLALGVASAVNSVNAERAMDPRPALVLVGSASETTRQQLHHAQTSNQLEIVSLDPINVIQNGPIAEAELERAGSSVRLAIHSRQDVAVVVKATRDQIAATQQLGIELGLTAAQVAQRIVDALAQVGSLMVSEGKISGIVATGGDTANALCNALAAQALEILGEVEAGIPVMRILGERPLPLVTKAGGFGSPAAIGESLAKVKHYV